MGSSMDEAIRAKALAEKQFVEKHYQSAKKYAMKAQKLHPELEGISQMVATFGVYAASEVKFNGELDFYSILGVDPLVDKSKLKKHSKKLALLLHPDKNRTVGADGAFKLVSEAWTLLSDTAKRNTYDQRRNWFMTNASSAGSYEDCYKAPSSHARLHTFWTVCTSCHVQYEYLRKYVNKRLSCKNCRGVFVAVETGMSPHTNYSHVTENGYGGHAYGNYIRLNAGYCASNVSSGHHNGNRSEYVSNISFQRNLSGNSLGVIEPSGLSVSSFTSHPSNGDMNNRNVNGFHQAPKARDNAPCNGNDGVSESSKHRRGRATKKRRVELGCSSVHGEEEKGSQTAAEPKAAKLPSSSDTPTRRWVATPGIDGRQLLIEKARSEICRKLEEFKVASEAAVEALKRNVSSDKQTELKRSASMTISVPDSDFHDFDEGRTEECFMPRQVWALYDEEDGMPRLYCQIREVISLHPFKIHISYLASKSDSEFGSVSWVDSGFTKSCGSFRAFHSETVDQVNIFSHLLTQTKVGRGGCVRIYPRSGEVWAIYRNWSIDWDTTTPQEIRHQYEMVEVLGDYSEDMGVWIAPLVKLEGYKTVYQRVSAGDSVRCIPRREMLRFSHQVPACSLKVDGTNLPEGCWDLDPAATPDELLQRETDAKGSSKEPDTMADASETQADRTKEPN